MKRLFILLAAVPLGLCMSAARAEDLVYMLVLKDHKFTPTILEIPVGKKVRLVIKNQDSAAEEFDSDDLHREKVIPAGMEAAIYIGPLPAGSYTFKGEYNPKTATGTVVVK